MNEDNPICISRNGSNCFCNDCDYNDRDNYESTDDKLLTDYCKHNNFGIRSSRNRVTMKDQCDNYNTEVPIYCYICNSLFTHRELRNIFWGCNECFIEKVNSNFPIDSIGIKDIQLCTSCSVNELVFHHDDENRKTGLCSFKRSMLTKGASKR